MKLLHHLYDAKLIARMAADLVKSDAWRSESDAIRCLMNRGGYAHVDVALMVGEARTAAFHLARTTHHTMARRA